MKKRSIFLGVLGILVAAVVLGASFQAGEDLFQKALRLERNEGKLEEAIVLYQKVVNESKDQPLAAKAQLRIGYCYEKLGLQEANKAFQKVIENYPGQKEAVKEAREKLAILVRAQAVIKEEDKGITMRKLTEPRMAGGWGAPSPDGRYFAFYFDPPADLAVRDFATGEIRRLNMNDVPKYGFGAVSNSCWSPDGKQIAFGQFRRKTKTFAVRAVNFDGSNARTVYKNTHWIDPYAWSPDGKTILTYFSKGNARYQLGLLQVHDGTLLEFDFPVDPSPSSGFSPDNRYLALSVPQKNGSKGHDVSLFSISEEKVIPLIEHPANDRVVGWAPDGKWIFFWSDRTGSADLWAIRVSDGKAQGDPVLIQKDMGGVSSMWMIPSGSLFYSMNISTRDVYVAKVDFDKNRILDGPRKATQHITYRNYSPSWSLDGEYLAFFSNQTPGRALCILSQKTGEVQTIPLELISFGNPAWVHWSPDGQSIVHTGFDKPGSAGFFRTDIKTGKMKMIFPFHWKKTPQQIRGSRFSRDGNTMFEVKHDKNTKKDLLVAQNLATQTINELYVVSDWIHGLALSPDEKQLAFFEGRFRLGNMKIKIFPVDGGESRILHTFEKGEWLVALDWTPDGRNILFSKGKRVDEKWQESLWNISLEGGEPQQIEIDIDSIDKLQIHPDGKQIAFESGRGGEEIWVMENILSVLKDRK